MAEPSIAAQVVALQKLTVIELRLKWKELTGEDTTQRNKAYLVKRCAWEIQRRHFGDELSPEAKARLHDLQAEFRDSPPETWFRGARHNRPTTKTAPVRRKSVRDSKALKVGTVLTREYKNERIIVSVRGDREFEWRGEIYTSLSAVARAITNSHLSGRAFFGLNSKKDGEQ